MAAAIAAQPTRLVGRLVIDYPSGYGFVNVSGIEFFLHKSEVRNREQWKRYRRVSFTPAPGEPGGRAPRALDAEIIEPEEKR